MILVEDGVGLAIGYASARCVALVHLNAMGVELVLLESDGFAQRLCAAAAEVASARASMFFWILCVDFR
jgi:hypothetical protein